MLKNLRVKNKSQVAEWKDIFVHAPALNGIQLNEGDKVEYQEEEGRKAAPFGTSLERRDCTFVSVAASPPACSAPHSLASRS